MHRESSADPQCADGCPQLKRFKPHQLLSFCVFMFGLTTILQGFVTNYKGLLTTRFFLGFFETGMFPYALHALLYTSH